MDVYLILGGEEEVHRPRCRACLTHIKSRLKADNDFWKHTKLICSGNHGLLDKGKIPESVSMKEFLIQRGVPHEAVLIEEKSTDTLSNFIYSYDIIKLLGATKVFLVTDSLHMRRAANIFYQIYKPISFELVAAQNSSKIFSRFRMHFWHEIYRFIHGKIDKKYWHSLADAILLIPNIEFREYFLLLALDWDFVNFDVCDFSSAKKYFKRLPIHGNNSITNSGYAILLRKLLSLKNK